MRVLDTFCKAGGAGMGYHQAGFEVVGVDIEPQKNYPFEFHQGDALEFIRAHGREFDLIHASPPCQRHSAMTKRWGRENEHPELIEQTRYWLVMSTIPYVIENVEGAARMMKCPTLLCGSMFGLQTACGSQLRRHRLFETSFCAPAPRPCDHNDGSAIGVYGGGQHPQRKRPATIGVYGSTGGGSNRDGLQHFGVEARREAMGIAWMTGKELSQAIPPAYTKWIGEQFLRQA